MIHHFYFRISKVFSLYIGLFYILQVGIGQNMPILQSTALTIPSKTIEKGFFQPLRYGINDRTELSTFLFGNMVNPNISIKRIWKINDQFVFSSFHALSYPTPLLRAISRRGPGGLMPANTEVPTFLNFKSRLFLSFKKSDVLAYTGSIGITYTPKFGNHTLTTIDYPILYPRTSVYHNRLLYRFDLNFLFIPQNKNIYPSTYICRPRWEGFYFQPSLTLFMLPNPTNTVLIWEHKMLVTKKRIRFSRTNRNRYSAIQFGYLMTYGKYPFGRDFSIFPLIDVLWGRNNITHKKTKESNNE